MCGFHLFLQGIRRLRELSTVSAVSDVRPGRIDPGFPRAGEQDDGSLPQTPSNYFDPPDGRESKSYARIFVQKWILTVPGPFRPTFAFFPFPAIDFTSLAGAFPFPAIDLTSLAGAFPFPAIDLPS